MASARSIAEVGRARVAIIAIERLKGAGPGRGIAGICGAMIAVCARQDDDERIPDAIARFQIADLASVAQIPVVAVLRRAHASKRRVTNIDGTRQAVVADNGRKDTSARQSVTRVYGAYVPIIAGNRIESAPGVGIAGIIRTWVAVEAE